MLFYLIFKKLFIFILTFISSLFISHYYRRNYRYIFVILPDIKWIHCTNRLISIYTHILLLFTYFFSRKLSVDFCYSTTYYKKT